MVILEKHPLLYYAIEEGVVCAQKNYYAAGIIAFAQLANLFNIETPPGRHSVAHKMLDEIPSKVNYDQLIKKFKIIAEETRNHELKKIGDKIAYNQDFEKRWLNLIKPLIVETDAE